MRFTRTRETAERIGLLALPMLLVLTACNRDSGSPAIPTDPTTNSESAGHGCLGHDRDCGSGKNGRIAYSRFIDYTGFGIFSAKADGSDVQQVTTPVPNVFDDGYPNWSPDGSTIFFERDYLTGISQQLYRVDADGGHLTQLFDCAGRCLGVSSPIYSPDGRRIAFDEANGDESNVSVGIWVMNPDGSNQRQITQREFPSASEDHRASWSPDGRRIAFTRTYYQAEPAAKQAIFVCNLDGTDLRRITPWQLNAASTDWSPDGRLILFTTHYDIEAPGEEQLYTVHPDGTGMTRMTPSGFDQPSNILGRFSPDGRKITFVHQTRPEGEPSPISLVYTMNADGSNVALVSFVDDFYYAPAWGTHR